MEDVVKSFGIQWPLLVASIINFVILLYLMKRFLYKPVLKVLDERKTTIAKSLDDAKQIEEDKKRTEERLKASLRLANEQALKTLEQAKQAGVKARAEIIAEAEAQAEQMIARAKAEIAQEKEEAARTLRKETARLLSLSMEKVLVETRSEEREEKLLKEALEQVDGKV